MKEVVSMFNRTRITNKAVLDKIEYLRNLKENHKDVGQLIMQADNGNLFPLDLLAFSVVNRSLNLLIPFCDMVEEKNIIASAPFVRLQLDNLIRFFGSTLVDTPHEYAMNVLKGDKISNMKDRKKRKMSDNFLCKQVASHEKKDWIKEVYNSTSGYIHLSNRHMYNTFRTDSSIEGGIVGHITYGEHDEADTKFIEIIDCFTEITEILFKYLNYWGHQKERVGETNYKSLLKK